MIKNPKEVYILYETTTDGVETLKGVFISKILADHTKNTLNIYTSSIWSLETVTVQDPQSFLTVE